jgi:hypothetical protein
MPRSGTTQRKRQQVPSGRCRAALRVKVYAGVDPLSGKRRDLVEVIRPGKNAGKLVEQARARLLNQLDEKRSPLSMAMGKWLWRTLRDHSAMCHTIAE